ncbi:MAG TPA: hypothetical protein VFF10_03670 [Trueperaceae bacterium]|nr:hypothetical protein [Trueperaceae bacterium]
MLRLRDLGPVGQLKAGRLPRRTAQLVFGLLLFGLSISLLIQANLGAMPWDVLHQGLARLLPLSIGTIMIFTGLAVLLLWVPLREAPGVGTLANAVLIGIFTDVWLVVVPVAKELPNGLIWQIAFAAGGIVLNGYATALYIGSQFGRGPRDGLMTGLARVTGRSIRLVRTGIEVAVVTVGWLLGGVLGWATLAFALTIGPLVQAFLPYTIVDLPDVSVRPRPSRRPRPYRAS